MANKNRNLIISLIIIIVILLAILFFAFVLRPTLDGYVVQGQSEGYEAAIFNVVQVASTCQPFPVTYQNLTVTLYALECQQSLDSSEQ